MSKSRRCLNQFAIRITDPAKSLAFYKDLFGLKELAKMDFDSFTVWLLGYPLKDDPDLHQGFLEREGILELIHNPNSGALLTNASTQPTFGFYKLCFTVPDIDELVKTLEFDGVEFVSKPGIDEGRAQIAAGLGLNEEEYQGSANQKLWDIYKNICWVKDPDGYMIEIVPQRE